MKKRRPSAALPETERVNDRSGDLDLRSIREIVASLHADDHLALAAVGRTLPSIARAAQAAAEAIGAGGRLIYVGAGTSGRLGMLDAAECPPTFGTDRRQVRAAMAGGEAAMARAVEGSEDDPIEGARAMRRLRVSRQDFVCGISASSRTPFVLGALRAARRAGASTALVCCSATQRAAIPCDILILARTGPELIAGSTRLKAGTATKLVLNAISTAAMISLGKVYRGRMIDLQPNSQKLRKRARQMVSDLTGLSPRLAASLLRRAQGKPKIALAMHLTGLGRSAATRALSKHGLRQLELRGVRR